MEFPSAREQDGVLDGGNGSLFEHIDLVVQPPLQGSPVAGEVRVPQELGGRRQSVFQLDQLLGRIIQLKEDGEEGRLLGG